MSILTQHLSQPSSESRDAITRWHRKRGEFHPLLKMQIAPRLALGFLIPLLLAIFAMSNVGWQNQQLQTHETDFYQSLVQGNISLGKAVNILEQLRTNMLGLINDASKPGTSQQTLREDNGAIILYTGEIDTTLNDYAQHDLFDRYPDLTALFAQTGHRTLIDQQRSYTNQAVSNWQIYLGTQQLMLNYLSAANIAQANFVEQNLSEHDYAASIGSFLRLIQLNGNLIPAVDNAIRVEQNGLLWTTVIAGLCILLGIGVVGWLVFATLVQRLRRLRSVVNSIEGGKVDARLDVVGHDEIARVSDSINDMLDTIVGLLDETRQQRDELVNAEELKHLHQELQSKHEALNEANARLAALATTDPLTGLSNHRTVMNRLEEEISRCQRTQELCAVLFIDLDHFKQINDTWGHRAGDAVLCETGRRLSGALRLEDFVGRYGGEEFAVILTGVALDEARQVAERLQHVLADESFYWEADDLSQSTPISITGRPVKAIARWHVSS